MYRIPSTPWYAAFVITVAATATSPSPFRDTMSLSISPWNIIIPVYVLISIIVLLFTFLLWYKNRILRREITHRKLMHEQLMDANNRYLTLVKNLPISVFWKDTRLKYVSVNNAFARQMHRRTEDITGLVDADLFDRESALKFEDDDRRVITSGKTTECTDRLLLGDTTRWMRTSRTPLTDATGSIQGILGMFHDITDQKQSEDDLREAQRFNESVLGSTLDLVYVYDLKSDAVVYTNQHLSYQLGYNSNEISAMGSAFHMRLIHPDDVWLMNTMLARCDSLSEGTIESIEFRMHDVGGQWFWMQGRYTVFKRDPKGRANQIIGTLHDITERVQVENDLKIAFDRAQRYLDIVETIIVALDREGRITLINRKGVQILGQEASELIGKNWFELCVESQSDYEAACFYGAMISGNIEQLEYHENAIRSADGHIRTIAWHNSLLTDNGSQVSGLLSAGEDITTRKEADELLKTDKLRQNMLLTLNQLPSLTTERVMDYALDTALILTKSEIGYLYFYSEERKEFNLYSWSKNVMDSCRVMEKQTVYMLEKTGLWGEAVRLRQPIITNEYKADNHFKRGLPDGHVELRRHLNLPVFDEGAIVAVIGVANKVAPYSESDIRHLQLLMDGVWKIKKRLDIEGEVRRLNEELERKVELRTGEVKKAHDELERFFTLTPDLLCIATIEGYFVRCNKAWEQTLGYPLHELENRKFIDLVHPDDLESTNSHINRLSTGVEVIDFTNRYRCVDNSYRWIEWRSNAIGRFIYAAARDITEKKKNEDKLIQAKNEADRANRAKSHFLANMSHEIRTPLNAVIGYSELLSAISTNDKERGYIESITLAGRNLLRLINDILDLSKIEADMMTIHCEAVDITTLLKEIEQIFSFKIREKNIRFTIAIDRDLPRYLVVDEVRLRQVMLNLVGNAVKFTDRGFITIGASGLRRSDQSSDIDLVLTVEDSGMGVHPDELTSIFEAFHQQKEQSPQFGGTGLGLAISKKLVEIMNGSITVASTLGKGSTFTITLKGIAVASVVPDEYKAGSGFDGILFSPNTILVADDVPSNRHMLTSLLTEAGLTVLTADSGQIAVEMAHKKMPACIIMDLMMPGLDGISAAEKLKASEATARIPIIALADTFTDAISGSRETSRLFAGELGKPVSYTKLIDELKQHLPFADNDSGKCEPGASPVSFTLPPELTDAANELLGAVKMDDIRTFAHTLSDYGEQRGIRAAYDLGTTLLANADHFDIDAVRKLLKRLLTEK